MSLVEKMFQNFFLCVILLFVILFKFKRFYFHFDTVEY